MKRILAGLLLNIIFCGMVFGQIKFDLNAKFPTKIDSYSVVNGDTLLHVFISSATTSLSAFQQNRGKVRSTYNSITTGTIPLSSFRSLALNSIPWITPIRKCQSLLDESQKVVKASLGRNMSGKTGSGVIVGIVEVSGIDSQNDDFKKLVGTNKVTSVQSI